MKKMLRTLAFTLVMLVSALSVNAHTNGLTKEKAPAALPEQRLLEIESRVNEIKEMDKSQLSKEERKALRSELKELKQEARGGGIYLSTGAVIIIVLLLVILL